MCVIVCNVYYRVTLCLLTPTAFLPHSFLFRLSSASSTFSWPRASTPFSKSAWRCSKPVKKVRNGDCRTLAVTNEESVTHTLSQGICTSLRTIAYFGNNGIRTLTPHTAKYSSTSVIAPHVPLLHILRTTATSYHVLLLHIPQAVICTLTAHPAN